MACNLEECSFFKACDLAETILSGAETPVPRPALRAKLHELSITKEVFKRASEACEGMKEDGKCGEAALVSETRAFMFGSVAVPMMTQPIETGQSFGFGN